MKEKNNLVLTKNTETEDGIMIREGLFLAPSRAYGETYIEPIIRKIFNLSKPESGAFDGVDISDQTTYEIKAARVVTPVEKMKSFFNDITKHAGNNTTLLSRAVDFNNRLELQYDANIQNIKRDHFDILIYCLLFKEGIEIFKIPKNEIAIIQNWSGKHGRYDIVGKSGQFNIKKNNIINHEGKYFNRFITFDEVASIVRNIDEENIQQHNNTKSHKTTEIN